ncbi:hypothetical protein KAX75_05490 [candidate division WOR-3 bacterium]|nr:hypothetical protein [candidate division WOR-3 bacterium]
MYKKVYIETSIINRAHGEKISGSQIANILTSSNLLPVIGFHTIYECARTYLNHKNHLLAQCLFKILKDIDPSYTPLTGNLLRQEVDKLRTAAAVLPFFAHLNQVSVRIEVARLADGIFDNQAERFIRARENEIKTTGFSVASEIFLNNLRKSKRKAYKNIRTFDDLLNLYKKKDLIHHLIIKILNDIACPVSQSEARELEIQINSFPALRSVVLSNCYLNFILIKYNTQPSMDKIDDYRHIIDSSYSNQFLSDDRQQLKTVEHINKDLVILSWEEVLLKIRHSSCNS